MRTIYSKRRWMPVFRFFFVLCAAGVLATVAGCGADDGRRGDSYRQDGYMGYTNTNPNLINPNAPYSYEADAELIEQVLEPVEGIRDVRASFNGSELHVRILGQPELSDRELVKLRAEAQVLVQSNLPRYEVHVTTAK